MMDPIVTYLIHAVRNAAQARDWQHLDLLLDELAEAVSPYEPDPDVIRPGSPLNPYILN